MNGAIIANRHGPIVREMEQQENGLYFVRPIHKYK